jgi:hypothetical protein
MENPATWGRAEHIVDDVLANDDANRRKPPEQMLVGASRAKQICDALRAEGLLTDADDTVSKHLTAAEHDGLIEAIQAGTEVEWVNDHVAARTAALARDHDALAAKITRVEALADEWERTIAAYRQRRAVDPKFSMGRAVLRVRAALAGPEDTARDGETR